MREKRFRDNVTWMSFLLTLLVIWTHALNTELFLGEAGKNSAAGLTESLLGEHLAQIAVPGFFMMSAVLFFRNYRPEDTLRKWERTGNDEEYLLLLYEDELKDYLRREAINEKGRLNYERND